ARAQDFQPLPDVSSPVTDTTGTLSQSQIATLTEKLRAFEKRKGSQIAVVVVPTTEPETIDQYSIRLAEKVKIGRAKVDDGLIIVISMKDRKTRIEVGYGLEGAIPDSVASQVRRQVMNPAFREGRYFDGLNAGADAFIKIIDGEPLPAPAPDRGVSHQGASGDGVDYQSLLVMGIILVFVVGGILRAIFGRFLGSAMVGGVAGGGAFLLSGLMPIGIVGGIVAFVFSIVFSNSFGRNNIGSRGRGPMGGGWSSGGWASGGGSSSSDSWSGGGGGFGGGGSSGGWDN
ncbi:MAG: TPM domain-containing protein, partial [Burkholderiales bacterium]